jgi:transposase, IS5 family
MTLLSIHWISSLNRLSQKWGQVQTKARVRAKVEHPFRILKRVFGFVKVRFRGLKKNHDYLCAAFALVNLYMHRKRLVPLRA